MNFAQIINFIMELIDLIKRFFGGSQDGNQQQGDGVVAE